MKFHRPIILASSSPRRKYLMTEAGFEFTVDKPDIDESFPHDLPVDQVARYLAAKKAEVFRLKITDEIVVAADTIVLLDGRILNKPLDENEATEMLRALSGKMHRVITGVTIVSREREESFEDTTLVWFKHLTDEEISFYVTHYKPFDKAGAYGAQDWIGMVAIEKIEGSYFNVMGLPIHLVYSHLHSW